MSSCTHAIFRTRPRSAAHELSLAFPFDWKFRTLYRDYMYRIFNMRRISISVQLFPAGDARVSCMGSAHLGRVLYARRQGKGVWGSSTHTKGGSGSHLQEGTFEDNSMSEYVESLYVCSRGEGGIGAIGEVMFFCPCHHL